MVPRELHVMQVALDEARRTMRYTCPSCDRCVEDGPEGLKILRKGDQEALHRGGSLWVAEVEVERLDPPQAGDAEDPDGPDGPDSPDSPDGPDNPDSTNGLGRAKPSKPVLH